MIKKTELSNKYQNVLSILDILEKINDVYQKGNREDIEMAAPTIEFITGKLKQLTIHLKNEESSPTYCLVKDN